MQYKSIDGMIVTSNYEKDELLAMLKVQINMKIGLYVKDNETLIEEHTMYLVDRKISGESVIVDVIENGKRDTKTYSQIWDWIVSNIDKYYIQITFRPEDFRNKFPLINILPQIKPEIISGCVWLDYIDGVYMFKTRSKTHLPNELYYWEIDNSVFIFSDEGPQLLFVNTTFKSILDLVGV